MKLGRGHYVGTLTIRTLCPVKECVHNAKSKCIAPSPVQFRRHVIDKPILCCLDYAAKRCSQCGILIGENYEEKDDGSRICSSCQQIPSATVIRLSGGLR